MYYIFEFLDSLTSQACAGRQIKELFPARRQAGGRAALQIYFH